MTVAALPPIAAGDSAAPLLGLLAAALLLALAISFLCVWLLLGKGPRRARGYRRAQRLLREGKWQDALAIVQEWQQAGGLSPVWQGRLSNAEGECYRTAGVQAVKACQFEQGLAYHLQGAERLNLNPREVRTALLERMLYEARDLFARTAGPDTAGVHAMLNRVVAVQPGFPEAQFWLGLCCIREGRWEDARDALLAARGDGTPESAYLDPPLYLGGVLVRLGHPKDGLRYITEANRIDGNCPVVALQLGIAMVAAGTDGNLAIRALQRGLGPRGLPAWFDKPTKIWSEVLPEERSYIRKLTRENEYVCPLWGNDLKALVRQGQLALGQAQFRLEQYPAAAETFQRLYGETAPTHDVLRWLGVTLARLNRYDEAFKHLKTAFDLEEPKDRLTAGYLALCAAVGKPNRPEDKGPNVAWAVRTLRQYEGLGDREWVWLIGQVYGEALQLNMALSGDDQVFLCDHLVSTLATDPVAAAAYHQVAAEHPERLKPVYAWLYCRAAMQHNLEHERSLDLYARTFQTADEARQFFAGQQWDFEELEYAFLKQAAIRQPGSFPAALGADYPARGEEMLLQRSLRLEKENKTDLALASADVLLRLAPGSARAHDRLALLYYRRGKPERAAELLRSWCAVEPANALPWTRLAVVQHKLGQHEVCLQSMRTAIERSHAAVRADLAHLGARLAMAGRLTGYERGNALAAAQAFLELCLNERPQHTAALWLIAAVRAVRGDRMGLAAQAAAMTGPSSDDARFHYFAAVSQLAAGDYDAALSSTARAEMNPALRP